MARRTVPVALVLLLAAGALAQRVDVANASFEQGRDGPAGWTRTGGGKWLDGGAAEGRRAIAAVGTGSDSGGWQSPPVQVEPGGVYCLRFSARAAGAVGGTATSGVTFCNRDLRIPPADWTRYESYFAAPSSPKPGEARLRFGQWHVKGAVAYDDVELLRTIPVYARRDGLTLGAGEAMAGGEYTFLAPLGPACGNQSRPLARHDCFFNSNRWCLNLGSEVVYRHEVGGRRQREAKIELSIPYYVGGELLVEAARDGKAWRAIGSMSGTGGKTLTIPAEILPAREVWVRLTARAGSGAKDKRAGSLQVGRYLYTARLDGAAVSMTGRTHYVTVPSLDPRLRMAILGLGDAVPGGENVALVELTNTTDEPIEGSAESTVQAADGTKWSTRIGAVIRPGTQKLRMPYDLHRAGASRLVLKLTGQAEAVAETTLRVARLHDASYGRSLPGGGGGAQLWWCSSGWKVGRRRPAPGRQDGAMVIRAARNEVEAAQLVVRAAEPLKGLTARPAGPLTGPGGAKIPPDSVEILRVRYVRVTQPTDNEGVAGDWPDPLPPLGRGADVAGGTNQPLWVRVKVPRSAAPGAYGGRIVLSARRADGRAWQAEAALRVEVYAFEMPDRMTCTTAFGLGVGSIWRYHKLTSEAHRRAVLEKYLANYAAHHISPYDPAPLDRFKVSWPAQGDWQGGRRDRAVKHAGRSSLRVADTSTAASASARYGQMIRIPPGGVRLRFHYRTARPDHRFIVTLNHHDAGGQWMSGRNNDIRITGTGKWQAFDRTVKRFPDGAKSFRLTLWPALYSEQGATTGTVWYDELSLTGAAGGGQLVAGGGFEPIPPDKLTPEIDWAAWDKAMRRAIDHHHFNSFRLPIQGMGGGTFHARSEPSLLGYGESAPEYKAAFANYCRAVQEHLRENGWLDEAFVYWFDEPDPKDYAFVNNGFRKLKEAAPDIRRMLTEQVEPALVGGPDIWCPVTPNYNHDDAMKRKALGERFWWYVCTGPKAPYCTLFIDHPATELRIWLWQTFKRGIDGILVWQTNYWTSSAAYPDPDRPQNPYEDPMGWTSGYSTPAGTRRAWGNGDGRFVYPPEAAADAKPQAPVLDGPVDSIRWEMLRDGIEDYEYLTILARLLVSRGRRLPLARRAELTRLLTVPDEITASMTDFTKDPAPLELRRHAIAKAIEALDAAGRK